MAVRASCALLVVIGLARVAAAEPGFVWEAPTICPSSAEVQGRIERRLADDVSVRGIEVSITRDGIGFVAQIDMRAITVGNQVRTLRSARCDELADAVAVIVARLASEAQHEQRAVVVVAALDPEEPANTPHAIVPLLRVERPSGGPNAPVKWGGGIRALAVSGIGMVPSVGLGGELAGFVRRRATFVELALTRWGEQANFLAVGAPGGVQVGLQVVALRGGWSSDRMPLRAWLGVELGAMRGTGIGLTDSRVGEGKWTAISAGFGVAWPISRWTRLVGTFEVAAPVQRTRFALTDDTELYQPAAVSARCSLGLELGWR